MLILLVMALLFMLMMMLMLMLIFMLVTLVSESSGSVLDRSPDPWPQAWIHRPPDSSGWFTSTCCGNPEKSTAKLGWNSIRLMTLNFSRTVMQGGEDTKPTLGEYSDVEQWARGYIVPCMQCSIWTLSIKYMCKHESDAISDLADFPAVFF